MLLCLKKINYCLDRSLQNSTVYIDFIWIKTELWSQCNKLITVQLWQSLQHRILGIVHQIAIVHNSLCTSQLIQWLCKKTWFRNSKELSLKYQISLVLVIVKICAAGDLKYVQSSTSSSTEQHYNCLKRLNTPSSYDHHQQIFPDV